MQRAAGRAAQTICRIICEHAVQTIWGFGEPSASRTLAQAENIPDQVDLAKLRESKESLASLLRETNGLADAVLREKDAIDARLASVVENFAPERIDPVDRAILRLATWEILHDEKIPAPVAIDEAIELAKRFGTTDSGRFVNGVLDKIAKTAAERGA